VKVLSPESATSFMVSLDKGLELSVPSVSHKELTVPVEPVEKGDLRLMYPSSWSYYELNNI